MNVDSKKKRNIYPIVFFVAALLFISGLLFTADFFDNDFEKTISDFDSGWKSTSGEEYTLSDIKVGDFGGTVILEKTLPANLRPGDCLCFETLNVDVWVSVGDRPLYTFEAKENVTGRGYGYAFHEVGIPEEEAGNAIVIKYRTVNQATGDGKLRGVVIGPADDYIIMNVHEVELSAFLSILIIFFGVIILLIYAWIPERNHLPFDIASLGMGALALGAWLLIDTNIPQLISGHIYVWRALNRMTVSLIGFPIVSFANSLTLQKRKFYRPFAFWGNVVFITLLFVIRYIVGIDMILFFDKALAVYLSMIFITLCVMFADNYVYSKANSVETNLRFMWGGAIIYFVGTATDFVIYATGLLKSDGYGFFTRIGTLALLFCIMLQFLKWWIRDQTAIEKDRFLNKALQYSISSGEPEECIRKMMEFIGSEFGARRVVVFEDHKNGMFRGSYEWHKQGLESGAIDLLYLPYGGLVDELEKLFFMGEKWLIIRNPEEYKETLPPFYTMMLTNNVDTMITCPIDINGTMTGLFGIIGIPEEGLKDAAEFIGLISYFVSQLFMRRDEKKRLRFYSYNDAISGALNRIAYREFLEGGLDTGSAFGYLTCEIENLQDVNNSLGYVAGDKMVIDLVDVLADVFGNENVYRISGISFVAFGFESDEAFFYADIDRVLKKAEARNLMIATGAVYCAYGTMDINMVVDRANELLGSSGSAGQAMA